MKAFKKNLYAVGLVLAVALVFSLLPVGGASSSEVSVSDMAFSVMTEVVGLDLTKYKIELISNSVDQPETYGGLVKEDLAYNLKAAGSKAQVVCTFINKTLTRFAIYPLEGSLFFAQPLSTDPLNITKSLLQRYQAHLEDSYIQEARNLLDTVTEIKTTNVTMGNIKLQIRKSDTSLNFMWWYTIKEIDFPFGLSVNFVNNGQLKGFSDYSKFYHIGSTDVNISREEAIHTTKELAKDYTTLNVSTGNGDYKEVTLNLTDEHMVVELQIGNREPFIFYPLWYVRLYAETSIGGTDGFQAGIWADTGEIAYSQLTGHHGIIPLDGSSNQSSTQSENDIPDDTVSNQLPDPSQNSPNQNLILYLFAGIAATTIAATALLILKKRSK